jgi:hypothetical protein
MILRLLQRRRITPGRAGESGARTRKNFARGSRCRSSCKSEEGQSRGLLDCQDAGGPWTIRFEAASIPDQLRSYASDSPFSATEYFDLKRGSQGTTGGPVNDVACETHRYEIRNESGGITGHGVVASQRMGNLLHSMTFRLRRRRRLNLRRTRRSDEDRTN